MTTLLRLNFVGWVTALWLTGGGCGGLKVHRLADGRAVPDSWATCPVRETGQERATVRLDYDALYVMEPGPPHGVPSDPPDRYGWEMSYFRFWPGGQVLEKPRFGKQPDRSIPTAAQADDFAGLSTGVGRYSLVGNRLTMALIGFDETGWHWYQRVARMNEDGSFTIPGAPARSPRDQNGIDRVFHRHTVEGMKRFPDW